MDEAALLRLATALRDRGYRFVTPTPATHARVNSRPANAWAQRIEDVFGWSRPFRDGVLPDTLMALMHDAGVLVPVEHAEGQAWRSRVRLSSLSDMLFLHSAYPTEAANAVFFGPDTYRYAAAITPWLDNHAHAIRCAVDIGCGAGPGALLVARKWPEAEVIGVDINDAALQLTRVNAMLSGAGNVAAQHSNVLSEVEGNFDLIVSNPPYLADPAERAYRHGGGEFGAALSLAIVEAALERLAPGGALVLYTGVAIVKGVDPFQEAATEQLAGSNVTWSYREVDPDVFGEELEHGRYVQVDRIAAVVLTVKKGF